MKPLILRKRDVIRNAVRAHRQGRLAATSELALTTSGCRYRYDTPKHHCCVIGASIPPKLARKFDARENPSVGALIDDGLIVTRGRKFLQRLQSAHDDCIMKYGVAYLPNCRARLLAMLGIKS